MSLDYENDSKFKALVGDSSTSETLPRLTDVLARIRTAMTASDAGPLEVALEVVAMSATWDRYEAEAGGLSYTEWLQREIHPGRGLPWWVKRAEAVEVLGPAAMRMHHDGAAWAAKSVDVAHRAAFIVEVAAKYRRNRSACVSEDQARRIYQKVANLKPYTKTCPRCKFLEEKLKAAGIEV